MSLGLVLFAYQNCSQIQPGLIVTDNKAGALSVDGDTQAIILDQDNNIVDVVPESPAEQDAEPVAQEEETTSEPEVIAEEPVKENHGGDKQPDKQPVKDEVVQNEDVEHEDSTEEIQASSCVELAKKHKNSIDVSKLAVDAKISLLKGKTFIYSSAGPKAISSLSIGKSCGRTILCDVTIEKIGEVNGRLDLYKDSSVKEYDRQPKNIKHDL